MKEHTRRIRFAGQEHQQREIHAVHVHVGEVGWMYYGDGRSVLVVHKQQGRNPICEVIGENGCDAFGEPFRYEDFFLPEELAVAA